MTTSAVDAAPVASETSLVQDALRKFATRHGVDTARDAMTRTCARLLDEIGYESGPPRIDQILGTMEVRVFRRDMQEAGALTIEPDHYVITLRSSDPETRQRFTLGHELGHILLLENLAFDHCALTEVLHTRRNTHVEELCDVAAGELLLPMRDFRKQALTPLTYERLKALRRTYRMSLDSVLVRLTEAIPGTRIALLKRYRVAGTTARPLQVRLLGREKRLWLPTVIGERAFRPNMFAQAAAHGGRTVTDRLIIESSQRRMRDVRALLVANPTDEPTHRFSTDRTKVLHARDADFILIMQNADQPRDDWSSIAGRLQGNRRLGKGGSNRLELPT